MLLSAHVNKTKIAIIMLAFLSVVTPLYFANAFLDGIVYDFVVWFFGGILGLCGSILNYGVSHFVVGFGQEFNNTALFNMVNRLWTIVRDFFNLTFIFGLVYLGFSMILNNDSGNTRRWLVSLVIAALLVNFSLLISKIVIDVSNMLATQIIVAGLESEPQIFVYSVANPTEVDFAGSMMQQMRVTSVFNSADGTYVIGTGDKPKDQSLGYSMMLMILFLVSAFTFFSAGILIIIRGAALLIFMILSPFMFIGFVIPKLKSKAQEYWTQFLGRAFFAPIYMMMMYISLSVYQAISAQTNSFGSAFSQSGFADEATVSSTFGPFVLLIVLMIASLTVAKQLGVDGAAKAVSAGTTLRKFGQRRAGAATFGAGARLGRNTVGASAAKLSDSQTLKAWASRKGVSGMMGRAAMGATLKTADSSFDARNVGGMGKSMGIGTGRKGGYSSVQKDKTKKHTAMMDHIGTRDMDEKENKDAAAARAEKIRNEAAAKQAAAKQAAETFEKNKGLAPDVIEKEINDLDTSILALTDWLEKNKSNPTVDDYQKQKVAEEIGQKTREKVFSTQSIDVAKRRKELEDEVNKIKAQAATSTDATQTRILNEKAAAIERTLDNESNNLVEAAKLKAHNAALEGASAEITAKNEIKYKDQIAYMESLEAVAKFQKGLGRKLAGKEGFASGAASGSASAAVVSGSAMVGAVGGAVGAAGAGTAGWVFRGMGQMDENIAGDLRKKYGRDANAMAKNSDDAKALKKIREELNKEKSDTEEKKDDSSEG